MRGDGGARTEKEAQRGERVGGGGEGAPDVCNLLIEEHSEVISSDGALRWWGRYAEERENREQLMRVRHGLINFGLIVISLGASDVRGECCQERLV